MIYEADSFEAVKHLDDHSVDAVVTSPPYADLRDYGGADHESFPTWITPLLRELLRVVKPTGSLMLNLGRVFRDGEESDYHERTMLTARLVGWKRVDTIIWHKPNAHPFSAPQYLHNKHELVYWLAPTTAPYRGYTEETRTLPSEETLARRRRGGLRGPKDDRGSYEQRRERTAYRDDGCKPASVVSVFTGREKGIAHSAPMPLELARHLVALACPPGGMVLDPFGGSGTTHVACDATGRGCIYFDHDPAAVAEARRRTSAVQTEMVA